MNERSSAGLARTLQSEKEFTNVYVLKGGWREWAKKDYPVEKK